MDIDAQISDAMDDILARVFLKDKSDIASHHELRFKEDLGADSKQYFPILSIFEDKFEILMDYHVFQYEATTIQNAIEYVIGEYHNQHG